MKAAAVLLAIAACSRGGIRVGAPTEEITIVATARGLSPAEADAAIARPIERSIAGLDGVAHVRAESRASVVRVSAWLDGDRDADDRAFEKIRDALEKIDGLLPAGGIPSLEQRRGGGATIRAIVRGDQVTQAELRTWVDWGLGLAAMQTPGVRDEEACGGAIARVDVVVDPARLAAYGLGVDQVADALVTSPSTLPSGGDGGFDVRGVAKQSLDALAATSVGTSGGPPVRVADVARIEESATPDPCGPPAPDRAVVLDVHLRAGADAAAVADALRRAARSAPPGIEVQLVHAPARYALALGGDADLRTLAASWRTALAAAPGVLAVEPAPGDDVMFTPDRAKVDRFGVSRNAITTAVAVITGGAEVGSFGVGATTRSIYVKVDGADPRRFADVMVRGDGGPVALDEVITDGTAAARLDRFDLAPAMIVRFAVTAGDDADATAAAAIDRARAAAPPPAGVRVTAWREP